MKNSRADLVGRIAVVVCAAFVVACDNGAPVPAVAGPQMPAPVGGGGVRVAIVDSVAWAREDADGVLYKIAVSADGRADTIPNILVEDLPIVVGDTIVLGITFDEDKVDSLFQYAIRSRSLAKRPLPADVNWDFSGISLSDDARSLGYVVQSGEYVYGKIVAVPDYRLIGTTDSVIVPHGDFFVNATAFPKPDSAVICIDVTNGTTATWFRTRVRMMPWRAVVDTVVDGRC
jgi:hypothetical protein